jgi:competence protein ComEC
MRAFYITILLIFAALSAPGAKTLEVYFIDVEGGQATLIVTPSGQSMLVDSGWPGNDGRDAKRIEAAAKLAKVKRIDYFLLTHYDVDHVAGLPQLVERMPIVTFIDRGPVTEKDRLANRYVAEYATIAAGHKRIAVKPGDKLPLQGLDIKVVSSGGTMIDTPVAGKAQANPVCAETKPAAYDRGENALSIGFLLTFGKFRFIDLADLTWNKEMELVCPVNKLGSVDVFLVSHHGSKASNSPPLVAALAPRVAISDNGARKGGDAEPWQVIRGTAGLEDFWQLHYSVAGGEKNNTPENFIANPQEKCEGHWLKLSARPDGSFTVTNGRNGYKKTYAVPKG